MIAGWLLKIVIGFALVGLAVAEGGSPLVTRAQLDGVAHDAADDAARALQDSRDFGRACQVAQEVAARHDAFIGVGDCKVAQGEVTVTVHKEAWSLFMKKWDKTQSWYDVAVTVSSKGAT